MELSDEIRLCDKGAADNPYQGPDRKVLFVCSMGILRSATASRIYARKYNTRSAGTYDEALIPLTAMLLLWADQVVFVNTANYKQALKKFAENKYFLQMLESKSRVLDIPDTFPHMHPMLIEAFETQYEDIE